MPNGADKLNHFVAKVWDATSKTYRPIYVAPDATDKVQGDVKLSDAVNSTADAATGMTAATPKAVKTVQDSANNKLDKTSGADQSVASKVTFNNAIVMNSTLNVAGAITGNLVGNASTATRLQTPRNIALAKDVTGNTNFDGSGNITIQTTIADKAVTPGKLSANYAGAFEQGGPAKQSWDMVAEEFSTGTNLNEFNLRNTVGYWSKGANVANAPSFTGKNEVGSWTVKPEAGNVFVMESTGRGTITQICSCYASRSNSDDDLTGLFIRQYTGTEWKPWSQIITTAGNVSGNSWITTDMIQDGAITAAKVNFNYAGSTTKGGSANSADKLSATRAINLGGDLTGGVNFDGSANVTIPAQLGAGVVGTTELADKSITRAKINGKQIDGELNIVDRSIQGDQLIQKAVGTTELADKAVGFSQLKDEVGTVAVQSATPTSASVKLWVKI